MKLKEVFREKDELFFVFEYCETSLYKVIKEAEKPFSENWIRNTLY
jgi:hypothetical protein